MSTKVRAMLRTPNVMAVTFTSDGGNTYTIYRSTPGDTSPRIQCDNGVFVSDWGAIVHPERFGDRWETLDEFTAWCQAFIDAGHREYGAMPATNVTVTSGRARRTVTLHCLEAFVFYLGVIAFTINVLGAA